MLHHVLGSEDFDGGYGSVAMTRVPCEVSITCNAILTPPMAR